MSLNLNSAPYGSSAGRVIEERELESFLYLCTRFQAIKRDLFKVAEENQFPAKESSMYKVLKRLGNGEFVGVDSLDDLNEAVKIARELNATWLGIYAVRDSEGNDIELLE